MSLTLHFLAGSMHRRTVIREVLSGFCLQCILILIQVVNEEMMGWEKGVFRSSEVIINDANENHMTLSVIFILYVFGNWENTALLMGIFMAASTGMDQMPS